MNRKHVGMNNQNTTLGDQNATPGDQNATPGDQNAIPVDQNTTLGDQNATPVNPARGFSCVDCGKYFSNASNLTRHKKSCTGVANPLQCDVCMKVFSSSGAKSRHKKNVNCKPPPVVCQPVEPVVTPTQYPVIKHTAESGRVCSYCQKAFSRVDNLKRHLLGCRIKRLTESGSLVLPTNTNATTNNTMTINNTNCNNTTINNVTNITIHSFDRPCLDHIDGDTVKQMYLGNGRNLKKLIKAGVSRIWKTPENNTFQLPFSDKPKGLPNSEIMKVHCDGEDQYFPAHHVVDVLLHRCATVCESYLRQHYYDESIPGTGVLKHANVLEELAIEFQETWDEDSTFRNEYKPFVKSAILECLQLQKEKSNGGKTSEENNLLN